MIIPKITDVRVTLDIVHPQATVGLKNSALFVKGDKQSYKEYTSLDAVEADYNQTTSVYQAVKTAFDQNPHPELVAVVNYTGDTASAPVETKVTPTEDGATVTASTAPTGGIAKAAFDYFYNNWEIAILVDYNKADALALADVIEHGGYDGKGFHFNFVQLDETTKADASEFADYTRSFVFYNGTDGEYYAVALAAAGAQGTIGQVSWKFVSDFVDVTPLALTASDIDALEKLGLICYVTKASHSNQTDDKNLSGTYIDQIHGRDFVKSTIETNMQNTLSTAGKTPYDASGIAIVKASLTGSLDTAFNQGVIAADAVTGKASYHVSMPDIASVLVVDINKRLLRDVKFDYTESSGINTVKVNGSVNALV